MENDWKMNIIDTSRIRLLRSVEEDREGNVTRNLSKARPALAFHVPIVVQSLVVNELSV